MNIVVNRIIYSKRRSLSVEINRDGQVIVRSPLHVSTAVIDKFIQKHQSWILKKLNSSKQKALYSPGGSRAEYLKYRSTALNLALDLIREIAPIYGVSAGRVSIKNQKKLWGSCSAKRNLNFNYKIALIPKEFSRYIVVHEVCHLVHLNHSQKFWDLVAKTIPNYKEIRKKMRSSYLT